MAQSKADEFDRSLINLARYAKALSHPARIAILHTLAKKSTCICGEIVEEIPLAQSTVSQHLRELKGAEIITGEIDGPKNCYCLNPASIHELEKSFEALFKILKKGIQRKNCC